MNIFQNIASLFSGKSDKTSTPEPAKPESPTIESTVKKEEKPFKNTIIKILNCFETGSTNTDYSSVFKYRDGDNGKKVQVTLGRGFTECGGALWKVFEAYQKLGGVNASELLSYKKYSCQENLPYNTTFLNLIKASKDDELFKKAQDEVYDEVYWAGGAKWFNDKGFKLPLSLAVIQDSILHSGSMLQFLMNKFPEVPPVKGGEEKSWIIAYVNARHNWLQNHSNKILNNTVYRTKFLKGEIAKNNWNLDIFPIYPNGVKIA